MLDYLKGLTAKQRIYSAIVLCGILTLLAIHFSPVRPVYVRTESIPTGLYVGIDFRPADQLSIGEYATFHYFPPEWSMVHNWKTANRFTKMVLAVPGDRIRIDQDKYIYRQNADATWTLIGVRAPTDRHGVPMSHNTLPEIIPAGYYYLGSDHPFGLDSRYLGVISARDIYQRVIPLLADDA